MGTIVGSTILMAGFKGVDANTLIKMQKKGVPVIDVRTPQEWKSRGVIKGAKLMMFFNSKGKADTKKWLSRLSRYVKGKNSPFIIYCAHANRTKVIGKWLTKNMGYKKVYELKGGIEYGWINKGKPVVKP